MLIQDLNLIADEFYQKWDAFFMENAWLNVALEIGFISFLCILYYFYKRRKILHFEENKVPIVMNFLLQACLSEKTENPDPKLDRLIESLDDFLGRKTQTPPLSILKTYAESPDCTPELRLTILEGLKELE